MIRHAGYSPHSTPLYSPFPFLHFHFLSIYHPSLPSLCFPFSFVFFFFLLCSLSFVFLSFLVILLLFSFPLSFLQFLTFLPPFFFPFLAITLFSFFPSLLFFLPFPLMYLLFFFTMSYKLIHNLYITYSFFPFFPSSGYHFHLIPCWLPHVQREKK